MHRIFILMGDLGWIQLSGKSTYADLWRAENKCYKLAKAGHSVRLHVAYGYVRYFNPKGN